MVTSCWFIISACLCPTGFTGGNQQKPPSLSPRHPHLLPLPLDKDALYYRLWGVSFHFQGVKVKVKVEKQQQWSILVVNRPHGGKIFCHSLIIIFFFPILVVVVNHNLDNNLTSTWKWKYRHMALYILQINMYIDNNESLLTILLSSNSYYKLVDDDQDQLVNIKGLLRCLPIHHHHHWLEFLVDSIGLIIIIKVSTWI